MRAGHVNAQNEAMKMDDPELWAPFLEWAKGACEEIANWGREPSGPPSAFRRVKLSEIKAARPYAADPLPRRDPQGFPYGDSLFRAAGQVPQPRHVIIGQVISG